MTSVIRIPNVMRLLAGLVLLPGFVACAPDPASTAELEAGQTRAQVRSEAGEPDTIRDLTLPDEPFWGPQEGLATILRAGTLVEEWQYEVDDDILYVWFAGGGGVERREWTVVDVAAYPADANF